MLVGSGFKINTFFMIREIEFLFSIGFLFSILVDPCDLKAEKRFSTFV